MKNVMMEMLMMVTPVRTIALSASPMKRYAEMTTNKEMKNVMMGIPTTTMDALQPVRQKNVAMV